MAVRGIRPERRPEMVRHECLVIDGFCMFIESFRDPDEGGFGCCSQRCSLWFVTPVTSSLPMLPTPVAEQKQAYRLRNPNPSKATPSVRSSAVATRFSSTSRERRWLKQRRSHPSTGGTQWWESRRCSYTPDYSLMASSVVSFPSSDTDGETMSRTVIPCSLAQSNILAFNPVPGESTVSSETITVPNPQSWAISTSRRCSEADFRGICRFHTAFMASTVVGTVTRTCRPQNVL